MRLLPGREGLLVWTLVVHDGKADSVPAQVRIHALKKGTLPVAKPLRESIEAQVAVRNQNVSVANVVLDGSLSQFAPAKPRRFIWKQIEGEDLRLPPEKLSKEVVGLRIYHPGRYRFLLTVFDGEFFSLPLPVQIQVQELALTKSPDSKEVPAPNPAEPLKDQSGSLLPPPKSGAPPAANPERAPQPAPAPERSPDSTAAARPAPDPAVPSKPEEQASIELQPVKTSESVRTPPLAPEPDKRLPASLSNPKHRAEDPLYQRDKKRLEALVQEPGITPEQRLIAALDNRDWDLRTVAAYALVRRGVGSVPALIEVLEKGSSEAKREAHWALKELSKEAFAADGARWRKWWSDLSALPVK